MHIETDEASASRRVRALMRQRDAAVAAAAAERERNRALLQQCDRLAQELYLLRARLPTDWQPSLVTEEGRQLAEARATISAMERSWFWRMRRVYVWVRNAARRVRGAGEWS